MLDVGGMLPCSSSAGFPPNTRIRRRQTPRTTIAAIEHKGTWQKSPCPLGAPTLFLRLCPGPHACAAATTHSQAARGARPPSPRQDAAHRSPTSRVRFAFRWRQFGWGEQGECVAREAVGCVGCICVRVTKCKGGGRKSRAERQGNADGAYSREGEQGYTRGRNGAVRRRCRSPEVLIGSDRVTLRCLGYIVL